MKNKLSKFLRIISLSALVLLSGCQKDEDFKITEWNSGTNKPIIFYISGDAGFNTFTKGLGTDLHTLGYDVFALDTKAYFWNKKTPEQTSQDIENYINEQLQGRKNQQVILLGYSFGADVTPFVYNRFTPDLKSKIQKVFIMGPSKSNDFQIHLDEYFGVEPKGSLQVIPEINEMGSVPVMLILSDFEFLHFPYKQITLGGNYRMKHIPGNHHYGNNTQMLANFINHNL
ncbi:virulence factor family protein [Chryseobacterium sp. T16E-39]|uniref:AcvB/VirJ family lysyl-phosphatidylglycerol hydrolase n=1 Tax=Chryseobacterium sp. T16E-39 TaxID=2015076 RepID=UPI000B5B1BBF|nr:AcvB/VirJ family lysyl-phosphatidylglycerol hydrolase [Chryseobacterium sp. T16E-39]ASK28914.1 virulence factor family protein [Chryseobacterium sp. T16E-39]